MAVAQKIIHFYCWRCREYHLKAHPHYRTQRQRLVRRKTRREESRGEEPEKR